MILKKVLCNCRRLQVTQLVDHVIDAEIIPNGDDEVKKVLIPRMFVSPPETKFPFRMRRR